MKRLAYVLAYLRTYLCTYLCTYLLANLHTYLVKPFRWPAQRSAAAHRGAPAFRGVTRLGATRTWFRLVSVTMHRA